VTKNIQVLGITFNLILIRVITPRSSDDVEMNALVVNNSPGIRMGSRNSPPASFTSLKFNPHSAPETGAVETPEAVHIAFPATNEIEPQRFGEIKSSETSNQMDDSTDAGHTRHPS
jgi:hypothetical protein